ncbi:unnamed protein product, partial [Symbiodinium necroappetens]
CTGLLFLLKRKLFQDPRSYNSGLRLASVRRPVLSSRRAHPLITGSVLNLRVCTFRNIFAKWRLATQFARASRTLRRCSKDHKRQYYIAQVDAAESAAAQGDQRSLYLIVRRLSPRKRQIAGRLRSEDGKLLTREEELQAIVKYGNATFAALFDDHPILPLAEDLPIAATSIAAELAHLGIAKAVPKHIAPAATWKLCASALGGETLTAHFRQGTYATLDADWKALAGSLHTQLLHSLAPLMQCMPQFAYASQRGTANAIAKAHHHFELVADLLGHARVTRFQHQAGKVRRACTGGIGLSLDLSKAFDGVNRSRIYEAMQSRGVPASVITLVQQLHHHAKYVYRVGTCTGSTLTSNGIKQGCVIAPYLWNYFSLAFLLLLQEQRDLAWIQNLLSLFADDVWGAWLIESSTDFHAAISDIQLILETLETLDMTINFDKTAILLKLVGKDAKQLRRDHLFQKAGQSFLRVHVHGREQGIPVKDQHIYLGTVVTYTRRLERNMQHRLQAARTNYQGLRKLLNGSHHLGVSHRIRLWVACICSSALYSQHVVGVTDKVDYSTSLATASVSAILHTVAQSMAQESSQATVSAPIREPPTAHLAILEGENVTMFGDQLNMGAYANEEAEIFAAYWTLAEAPPAGAAALECTVPHGSQTGDGGNGNGSGAGAWTVISRLRHDKNFVIFMRNDANGALAEQLTSPLRTVLIACMIRELMNQAQQAVATEDSRAKHLASEWLNQEGNWNYRRWNPAEKRLELDKKRTPLQHTEAIRLLNFLLKEMTGDIIQRFAASKTLAFLEKQGAQVATFHLEISLRGSRALEVYEALGRLTSCSLTNLIGVSMKRDTLPRSMMARRLADQVAPAELLLRLQVFWEKSGRAHRALRLMGFKLLGWSAPEQQHDVTELIDFLHGRLASVIINAVIEELIQAWHATQQAGITAYNAAPGTTPRPSVRPLADFGFWMMKKLRLSSLIASLIMSVTMCVSSLLCTQLFVPNRYRQLFVQAMDPQRQRRTLREEDLDWMASRVSLLQMQINGLAEGLEAIQQALSRLAGQVHGLEERVPRRTAARNKCHKIVMTFESLETMDD